jgi:SAM-dependent methyltransferase
MRVSALPSGQELEFVSCKRRFSIVDGFPAMMPNQTSPLTERVRAEKDRAYHIAERKKSDNEQYLSGLLSPLGITDNSTFLDLGCGSGYVNNYLACRTPLNHNIGFDIDPDAIRMGRELETSPGKILWFCASGLSIPLRDSSVDHLVCRGVMPLVSVTQVAAEIGRIMRPSGTAVILLHHWTFYLRFFSLRLRDWKMFVAGVLILSSSLWFNVTGRQIQLGFGRHRITMSFQTEYRIRRLLKKHGLSVYRFVREPDFLVYVRSSASPTS